MVSSSGAFELAGGGGLMDSLAAFELVEAELGLVADEELVPVNIDVLVAVTTVLGVVGELRGFREELMEKLPSFDVARFDRLEAYARAAGHAHAMHLQAVALPDVSGLVESATELREVLLADTAALARRGLVSQRVLSSLKGPVGYRNLAFDLSALSSVLRERWSEIENRTAIAPAELAQARVLADRLLTAVGLREQGPALVSASSLTRQRAFTLLVKAYSQARRGMSYLRWDEGDLDRIAPSLYEKRAPRRRSEEDEVEAEPVAKPVVSNGGDRPVGTSTGLPGESPFEDA